MKEYDHDDMEHKPYKCSECGLRASSKNAAIRSVFPSLGKMHARVIAMISCAEITEQHPKDLTIRVTMRPGESMRDTLKEYFQAIRDIPEEDFQIAVCGMTDGHDWEPDGWKWKE